MKETPPAEANEVIASALERAERLPDYNGPQLDPSNEAWDDGNVWFDNWGKWEKCD